MEGLHQRAQLLLSQSRFNEAIELLESHVDQAADDVVAQYLLAYAYLNSGDKKKSRTISEHLLELAPDEYIVLSLAADVELADELHQAAESWAENIMLHYPRDAGGYIKMAQAKLGQRNYDRTLEFVNHALEIDPENTEALNMKILVGGILGDHGTQQVIEDALHLNPESASTIANQGMQLLREGKVDAALERLEYALSLEPTNDLARYAMSEAMKNKFWLYRMYFKYGQMMSKLSSKHTWAILIGAYVLYQLLSSVAKNNESLRPFLQPVVYLILGLFLMTWVLDPLMNAYLLSNKYGKLLLDDDDKKMAQLTGASFLLAIVSAVIHFTVGIEPFLMLAIVFGLLMIPLGTFLKPHRPKNRKMTTYYTIALVVVGLLGALLNQESLLGLAFIGIFAYQWIINGIMIKENARVFGD